MSKPRKIKLEAMTSPATKSALIPQAEAMVWVDATDRTLRVWAERGLPVQDGPKGRPVYPGPELIAWTACYRARTARAGRAPRHLSIEEARRFQLAHQYKMFPQDFVLVPLDWDHPLREQQLRRAAKGCEPKPVEDDPEPDDDE